MRVLCLLLLSIPYASFSQNVQLWNEYFGLGCNSGNLLSDYMTPIGVTWTVTETGYNASTSNTWFVSAEENGNAAGQCGTGCGGNPTLHIGALNSFAGTDLGAAYYEGLDGFCDLIDCGATDKRAESPVIDCSIFANVAISFNYIEGGNALDNATLWYFDGSTWSLLVDLPKTPICANGQGQWTAYSVNLPTSSQNNANVRIGFRWQNNDDGQAMDPSFAVDNIIATGDLGVDAIGPTIVCPPDTTIYTEDYCYFLSDFESLTEVADNLDPYPYVMQLPEVETFMVPGVYVINLYTGDFSGNTNQCSLNLTVIDDDAPALECPSAIQVVADYGATSAMAEVPDPVATDNCAPPAVTNDFTAISPINAAFPIGTTMVTFTATDASLNTAQCSVDVVVSVSLVNCCLGDLNCDGVINVADMLILISEFGCVGSACSADLNDDTLVGVSDLQLFNQLYGTTCPQ